MNWDLIFWNALYTAISAAACPAGLQSTRTCVCSRAGSKHSRRATAGHAPASLHARAHKHTAPG